MPVRTPKKAPPKKATPLKVKAKSDVKTVHAEIVDDTVDMKTTDELEIEAPEIEEIAGIESPDTIDAKLPVLVPKGSRSVTTLDPLTLYLREIQKHPVLSREQEKEIATKYFETKDSASAEMLVRSNLRFVVKVAAEYAKFSAKMIEFLPVGSFPGSIVRRRSRCESRVHLR